MARMVSKKAGLPPGSLVYVGEKDHGKASISVLDYNGAQYSERSGITASECSVFKDKPTVTWINVVGLGDIGSLRTLGNLFDIHPLVLEDILNTNQRPKYEDFDTYLFVVLKMLFNDAHSILSEQVSIVVGSNYIISFQERQGDVFDPVRERIRTGKGRLRTEGADYLGYALIDAIVDNYFTVLEQMGERIEKMEEKLVIDPTPETLQRIHNLKRDIIYMRKGVWPLREVVSNFERGESPLVKESTIVYLRDVYDHTIQVIDTIETYRDMTSGLTDLYMSSISNKMNEVMKVLTIIATIFIPLTFIAGIYGMNFNNTGRPYNMPELYWEWGYPATLLSFVIVSLTMVYYFKRKKWL